MLAPLIAALHHAGHEIGAVFLPGNSALYRADIVRAHVQPSLAEPSDAVIASIREYAYDYALIATEKSMGYDIACRAEIPRRVGFWNGFSKPFKSLWLLTQLQRRYIRPLDDGDLHEVESLYRLGHELGIEPKPTRDIARLQNVFFADRVETESTVLIQVTKKWQEFASSEMIIEALRGVREFLAIRGLQCKIVGIRTESTYVDAIAGSTGLPARLYDDTRPWVQAIAKASAIVSPDTGAAHIAGMLGIPIVDLFPPASSAAQRARWSPWAAPSSLLHVRAYDDFSSEDICKALGTLF